MHPEVLNETQLKVLKKLPKLSLLKKKKIYLAGGTALALQLGHRTSIDFDFYTRSHFSTQKLLDELKGEFGQFKPVFEEQDTLRLEIEGTELSFFTYEPQLLRPLVEAKGVYLASPEDIAAMKLAAIVQRGTKRDFIDIYFLIKELGLDKMFRLLQEKYPWYKDNPLIVYRALNYFSDAEKENIEERGIKVFEKDFSWEKAKRKIEEEVKKHQLRLLKY